MSDPKYLRWVKRQRCVCQPCASKPEAHHSTAAPAHAPNERAPKLTGRRGKSQKSADYYAFPLCLRHHGQFHRLTGYFDGWDKAKLRDWQTNMSARSRARYDRVRPPKQVRTTWAAPMHRPSDVLAADFIRNNDLEPQLAHDLRALVAEARREGQIEGRSPRKAT